jgi:predicted DNA-binding antitoxin AbrB/MazE fold protein
MTVAAKYEHGVFKPLEEVEIEEGRSRSARARA